jgi:L-ascorbate metabolism protein UlaG (beta-lactamase superfamily)
MIDRAPSDHFDGQRFLNPFGSARQPLTAVPRMMRTPRTPWPARLEVLPQRPPALDGAAAVVTFIGHSTFLIQTASGNIVTDPMYSDRAGPLNRIGPRRVREPAVRFDDLPEISTVLLSHNHYDHCDLSTLRRLARRYDPLVITPLGNASLVRSAGIRRIEELDWWQSSESEGLPVTLTPARHFSARTPWDRNRALWGGFVVTVGNRRLYFAGDTAYTDAFVEIRRRFGPIDLALLPIGAYEPRWFMRAVHMDPEEAVQAFLDLEATEAIGMHFGTFQLTAEGIDDPLRGLEQWCEERNVARSSFRALEFGESARLEHAAAAT